MEFFIGCNYWASNAGADMWRDWDADTVREDLKILSENGVELIRVFPNWRDFQPIVAILGGAAKPVRFQMRGETDPENPYWLDPVMLEHFSLFCDFCQEFHIKILVGLVTGWMSGRTYIPDALFGKNLLTDPTALLFEQRLIRGMVTIFRKKEAIYAWDLGNECYALSPAENADVTANWTAIMTANIRACDPTRPVISGADNAAKDAAECPWTIGAEAEFCDRLVRHPYPYWSLYGSKDETLSYRTLVHATAQGKYFADLGGKPCMIEEIGTMGPMICSDEAAASFTAVNLFSAWANGMTGFLWWCANEQTNLSAMPYSDNTCEVELGLLRADRTPKPVLSEMHRIQKFLKSLHLELPPAEEDAVLIVSGKEDCWKRAFPAYAIARQAGLNVHFAAGEAELPNSKLYLLPSISGNYIMPRARYLALLERVRAGADLYISNDAGILSEFRELTGLQIQDSCQANETITVQSDDFRLSVHRPRRLTLRPERAEVLAYDSLNLPAVTVSPFGKGRVFFVNFPLEIGAIDELSAFDGDRHKVYRALFSDTLHTLPIRSENPHLLLTRHKISEEELLCVAVNHSGEAQTPSWILSEGSAITETLYGNCDRIDAFDACIFRMRKGKK